ncbi:MAG: S41 family peptidase [Candidatus Eremiobacteraeota bacterium]|nr:S41 family peptidase [Candidatus Eremiobacteraeota bacterium]MBV8264502.1 S41 family peptidase [Candidatus Eremiobacteraeota bacterium]MBV8668034.1 S41 family peptidase [Candidatus Eremiobacteraeota bacterium]
MTSRLTLISARWLCAALTALCLVAGGNGFALAATSAGDDVGRSMVDYSYERAASEFYKRTDAQAILDGAVSGMRAAIKGHGGDPDKLPLVHATNSDASNLASLNHELLTADHDFGTMVGDRNMAYAAIDGMMQSLHDRWTVFMTPKEYRSLSEGLDGGNFAGVGIVIDVDPGTKSLLVVQTIDGGPAEKAGLQAGDVILTVDGKTTQGLTTEQDSALIRGKAGTNVQLSVQRQGEAKPVQVTITRETIHAPSVRSRVLDGDIGYVQVLVFGLTTGQELASSLQKLDKQGVKGVILDLRNNGGGYLNAAIDVSSLFVPEGPIVSIDSRTKPLTTFDAENTAGTPRPLAVLVNGFTASASEITSGAIQDSGAGVLIGTRTFGKGVVQTIYPLPDGSAIKITTARYLTPNGRDINAVGIAPDIAVQDVKANDFGKPATDGQLQRAVAYIQDRIAATATQDTTKPSAVDSAPSPAPAASAAPTSSQQ